VIAGQADGGLDSYRGVVEALAGEYDLMDVAAAAVKLAHETLAGSGASEDEVQIPAYESFSRPEPRGAWQRNERPRADFAGRGPRDYRAPGAAPAGASAGAPSGTERPVARRTEPERDAPPAGEPAKPAKPAKPDKAGKPPARRAAPGPGGGPGGGGDFDPRNMVRIYIGAGRKLGMRPADLVGAIANEAQVNARGIGDIEIADTYSLVELPESDADRVVDALRGATLRGRKVTVRRDDGQRK
jgi:ATP-dependent RNA helicase DeaD